MSDSPEQQDSPPIEGKATLPLRFAGNARVLLTHRRMRMPLIGLSLVAVGMVGYASFFAQEEFDSVKLDQARDALEEGELLEARTMLVELYNLPALTPQQRGEVSFWLGATLAESAQMNVEQSRYEFAEQSIVYLREALDTGMIPELETRALYLLGRSYLDVGEIERSIEPLENIADQNGDLQVSVNQLLAGAWLQRIDPDPTLALAYNDRAMDAASGNEVPDAILLQRAEILLTLGNATTARTIVASLTSRPDPAPAQFLLAKVALAEGRRMRSSELLDEQALADEQFREALRLFEIAEGRDSLRSRRIAGSNYLRAQCLLELQEPEYALVELDEIERRDPKSAESIASGFLHAEVLQSQGRPQQAVDKWRTVLDIAIADEQFRNPWLSKGQIADRLNKAVRRFWFSEDYTEASLLLRSDLHFIPREESERLLAETYQKHADFLLKKAKTEDKGAAEKTRLQARVQDQRAGHVLSRLARLRAATRQYPNDLWASAQAYLRAEDARNAIRVLDQYILHEAANERTAEALLYLARSHLQLGDASIARQIANKCVEQFPKNPVRYKARLVASQAAIEMDDLESGETPLIDNLERDLLEPKSSEWRQSLFDLGKLLYLEQKWGDAEIRLTEAVRRYPQDERSWEARYLLAETLRHQAERDRNRSANSAVESQRVGAARSALSRLQDAVAQTDITLAGLLQRARQEELSKTDQYLLRNTSFLRAKLLTDLNRYEDAAQAYREFINRYYGRAETLDAYLAVATVFRRMNQDSEARTAIAQAYETLQALPPDTDLAHTSVGTIGEWQNLLTWLQSL
ncbi:MAG: tetratricopeptide repeat protein [Pirellulales bacterium]|nr:tetratricopeptide repeat protein [Pirellulales bacterium]